MRGAGLLAVLTSLLFPFSLSADESRGAQLTAFPFGTGTTNVSITPNHGPVAGGTEVTIKGQFGTWPYSVIFGSAHVPATRVDETTLRATTPAHLPGPVSVTIFEYDIGIATGLTYLFEGDAQDAYEPVLLPVFTWPISGAYGSEFRTDLRIRLVNGTRASIYGLMFPCRVTCIVLPDQPFELDAQRPETNPNDYDTTGTPGAFVYLPKDEAGRVVMNLRAYDTSRATENFGTEIPIVRASKFAKGEDPITLIGVPSDPHFRNTLRIYTYGASTLASVIIEGENGLFLEHTLQLPEQPDLFHPGYVELANFPTGAGMLRVTIRPHIPPISGPVFLPDRWAFISVTNNDTQHITLVTPQP